MSQGSPSKQDRIEKHLARQRGAGVRNLATSFGFSFGFQPSTTDQQDNEEPPAKRRKSAHSHVTKAEEKPIAQPERDPEPEEHRPTRRTAAKRKQPRRFEVASDDEKPETVASRNSADQNVSFIVSKKPVEKRGRPKKTQPATRGVDVEQRIVEVKQDHAPTVGKRGRPRKSVSPADQVKVASTIGPEDAVVQPIKPTRKRGRPPKTLVTQEPEAVTNGLDSSKPTMSPSKAIAIPQHQEMDLATRPVESSTTEELSKPSVKKRGRPRKAQTESTTPSTEIGQNTEIVAGEKESSKTRTARQTHHEPEHEAAGPSRRPRRQAAATAMSKVSEGFIEEEAPIDKKRRDLDLEPVSRRGRKKTTPSVLSRDTPNLKNQGDTPVIERTEDEGHVSTQTINATTASSRELPPQPQALVEVKTKATRLIKTRPAVLADPVINKAEDLPDAVQSRRYRVTKRIPLSETQTNIAMPTPSPEKPTKGAKVAYGEAHKSSLDAERRPKTTAMVLGIQDAQDAAQLRPATKSRVEKQVDKTIEKIPKRNESLPKPGCYPEAFTSGSTNATEHGVPNMVVADERLSGRAKANSAKIAPRRYRDAQRDDGSATSAAASSANENKRPYPQKIKATGEDSHKVDWLFEKATLRRSPAAKKNKKRPVSKRRIDDADAAGMDLDDLLSNIASFVPRSMRV